MTVRIAQKLGIEKIVEFSKKIGIYENPDKLLSLALGSAETTLLKLTSAYCSFVNGGKKINPILIDRIQDSEGNTIFKNEKRICDNCDQISFNGTKIPEIKNNFKKIFSSQTAYQMTSILEGVIKRVKRRKSREKKDVSLDLEEDKSNKKKGLRSFSLEELKQMLHVAINQEDYEKASKIRDEINNRKNN